MIDVLMLTVNDWANTGWRFFKCLQSLDLNVIGLKGVYHRNGYPEQLPIHPVLSGHGDNGTFISDLAEHAKVLHFLASTYIETGVDSLEKKVVIQHGGTLYRNNYEELNAFYNNFVDASVIQSPDLLGLGAKNERHIYYPVDTNFIQPRKKNNTRLIIGHFPSSMLTKGTSTITKVIEKLEDSQYSNGFEYVGFRRDGEKGNHGSCYLWTDNLKRIKECDIIIERMQLKSRGKPTGEWGNTALEAAASGCIVITNSVNHVYYESEFGKNELIIANSEHELEVALMNLFECSHSDIRKKQEASRQWAVDKHGMQSTAKRLWEKVYRDIV